MLINLLFCGIHLLINLLLDDLVDYIFEDKYVRKLFEMKLALVQSRTQCRRYRAAIGFFKDNEIFEKSKLNLKTN